MHLTSLSDGKQSASSGGSASEAALPGRGFWVKHLARPAGAAAEAGEGPRGGVSLWGWCVLFPGVERQASYSGVGGLGLVYVRFPWRCVRCFPHLQADWGLELPLERVAGAASALWPRYTSYPDLLQGVTVESGVQIQTWTFYSFLS